ncbi:hypothetical protein H2203_002711 [Taxawa tesnikishii (nom. ined.)]|nr:hypothetical protein H2203_002711 [Dothideales sp. JES 119]
MFSSKKAQEEVPGLPEAPFFTVDARLPEPPILTCNEDIPLRIVFATLNEETNGLFLQSLQVELVGYTHVRAHEVYRQESSPWILMSKSNMADRIIFPAGGTECVLDDRHWRGQLLPNNVAPSFVTCNITRKYELVARLGIRYQPQTQGSQLQYTSMELRLPVEVYSGIRPPPQLLEAIGHKVPPQHHTPTAGSPAGKFDAAGSVPPRKPTRTPTSPAMPPRSPATQGDDSSTAAPAYSEAPPSYEDAIAMDLPPVDGPRRDYVPPTPAADDDPLMRDEKRGWH